jgi:hypothetical protein
MSTSEADKMPEGLSEKDLQLVRSGNASRVQVRLRHHAQHLQKCIAKIEGQMADFEHTKKIDPPK